ncbi:Clathrin light chain [Fasciola gigantica]|uniref:Clathrin light chain n=1 Tax=Fasciola gigantica TaxID=46835 RepID=A0A504Z4P5_FASGI|nr:Clathrin light chain [Fasciola gigantica]
MMTEFDPVTDFLTREQEALGDLRSEIHLNDQSVPDVFASEHVETADNGGFVFLNGVSNQDRVSSPQPFITNEAEHSPTCIDSQFQNGLSELNDNTNSVFHTTVESNESWREAFNQRIAQKDADEQKLVEELKKTGQKELENWYKHYQNQLHTRARELREGGAQPNAENGDTISSGQRPTVEDKEVWEKICNMCDFQTKQKSAPDMTRMRSILLSLKPSN